MDTHKDGTGSGLEEEAEEKEQKEAEEPKAQPCGQMEQDLPKPTVAKAIRLGPTVAHPENGVLTGLFHAHQSLAEVHSQPVLCPSEDCLPPLERLIADREIVWSDTPLHLRLRKCLPWWQANAPPRIVRLIQEGIKPQWQKPPFLSIQGRQGENLDQARKILGDYARSGAVQKVDAVGTKHLLPWFLISKPEEGGGLKWRFISDCREINTHFLAEKFKLSHLRDIFPFLQKGSWGAKIDLKDAYFHLAINEELKPYLRHKVGNDIWEYQAGPFGLNVMPQLFQSVMKVLESKWRKKGVQVYVYLDDILLLGPTEKILNKHLKIAVEDLLHAGFKINVKKSTLLPSQKITHLGFVVNLLDGKVQLHPQKLQTIKKDLGKFITKKEMAKRQIAAILGQVRSNLLALPFLRAFTTEMVQLLAQTAQESWDRKFPISAEIKKELKKVGEILDSWSGRNFPQKAGKILFSDSSDWGWGGLNPNTGEQIQEYWREQSHLHINLKEMLAAINTVKSLSKAHENVELNVDNQVIYYYLQKGGGRKNPFNHLLQPFFTWLMEKDISLSVRWVPSEKCLADGLSRWSQDRGDYSLDPRAFQAIQKIFHKEIDLQVDLFASPGNKKLNKFVARWPHWQALGVDSLNISLNSLPGDLYANPPWSVIQNFLPQLKKYPQKKVLLVIPFWVSSSWWPQLIKMKMPHSRALQILPYRGLFKNCWGEEMPPPRWPLICLICSGKFWKGEKFHYQRFPTKKSESEEI